MKTVSHSSGYVWKQWVTCSHEQRAVRCSNVFCLGRGRNMEGLWTEIEVVTWLWAVVTILNRIYDIHLGANGAFIARQKMKRTYDNAVWDHAYGRVLNSLKARNVNSTNNRRISFYCLYVYCDIGIWFTGLQVYRSTFLNIKELLFLKSINTCSVLHGSAVGERQMFDGANVLGGRCIGEDVQGDFPDNVDSYPK